MGELRPADWAIIVIELLFVGVVLAQWFVDVRRKRYLARRRRDVRAFLSKGQELVKRVPLPRFMRDEKQKFAGEEWIEEVDEWRTATHQLLASLSENAALSFMLISSSSEKDTRLYSPTVGSFPVDDQLKECFQMLLCLQDNLRRIMENIDTYF